nr:phosphatase PAP2 family protein [Alsobacter ponti]
MVMALWGLWFRKPQGAPVSERPFEPWPAARVAVLEAWSAAFVALVLSRMVQNFGPARPRPMHDSSLGFVLPYGVSGEALQDWSSFPSDHAALAFALGVAVLARFRGTGWMLLAWALIVVSIPRVYLGLHYPLDTAAGALIGALAAALVFAARRPLKPAWRFVFWVEARHPSAFYAFAFLVSFEMATMFNALRRLPSLWPW